MTESYDDKRNTDKRADLAGPGTGDYDELEKILPQDYNSPLDPKETQKAMFEVKKYIEENLCKELNLMRVRVPLIVDVESGVNDYLDRDGSRGPVQSTSQMTTRYLSVIGGGICQSRTYMPLLRKAHLGEVSVTVWPEILKEMCAKKNIHVLN